MSARARIYLIAAGVVVLMLAVFLWAPDFPGTVETKLYDLHFKLRGVRRAEMGGDRAIARHVERLEAEPVRHARRDSLEHAGRDEHMALLQKVLERRLLGCGHEMRRPRCLIGGKG